MFDAPRRIDRLERAFIIAVALDIKQGNPDELKQIENAANTLKLMAREMALEIRQKQKEDA